MSKGKPKKESAQPTIKLPVIKEKMPDRPFWKSPFFWLIIIPVALYARILLFDLTALDDKFFVVDNAPFNQDAGNILKAFNRGLFVEVDDSYYRPILLVDMIIENHIFGTSPWGYHLFSLIFHIISVVLLFIFLKKIKIPEPAALILSLVFSIHPVLTQAVAWIPGRNDQILMIFFLSSLIFMIDFAENGKPIQFLLQFLFFLLAMLTKETAVFIPGVAVVLLWLVFSVKTKKLLPFGASWILALLIWYGLRTTSHPSYQGMLFQEMLKSGLTRLPAFLQYLGKIVFPVNLSAVPQFKDITLIWGFTSLGMLTGLVIYSKCYRNPLVILGIVWYLLFLVPVLIVPKDLNDQVYEHRLYLPFVGILLVLSQTVLFTSKWKEKQFFLIAGLILAGYATLSLYRIGIYADVKTFWAQAVKDSPNSAFAWLNKGNHSTDTLEREKFIRKAYAIDSGEMLVNYWMGINAQRKKKFDSAEFYYKRELKYSNFPDLHFNMSAVLYTLKKYDSAAFYLHKGIELEPTRKEAARVLGTIYFKLAEDCWNRNHPDSVIYFLRQVTIFDPANPEANHNLVMVLFRQNRRKEAMQALDNMRLQGMDIPQDLVAMSKAAQNG